MINFETHDFMNTNSKSDIKIRLLIVIDTLGSGGAEKSLINLLSLIDYKKVNVDLMLFAHGKINEVYIPKEVNVLKYKLIDCNINILKKTKYMIKRIFHALSTRIKPPQTANDVCIRYWKYFSKYLTKIPKQYDVAFAYAQRLPTLFVANNVRATCKYAWVNVTIHHDKTLYDFYVPFYTKYTKIVCVSDDVKRTFDACYPKLTNKAQVIYDINNPDFITSLSEEPIKDFSFKGSLKILTVARLNFEQKGYDILLQAAKTLKDRKVDFLWYILGEGPKQKDIEEFIHDNNLESNVILCGIHPNPYPFFKQADIYVQTSRYEGYGLAIAEARLLNVPIVTTPYDCVNLQIKNEVNGLITTFSPESVADCIIRLHTHKKLYFTIKQNLQQEPKGNLSEFSKIKELIGY